MTSENSLYRSNSDSNVTPIVRPSSHHTGSAELDGQSRETRAQLADFPWRRGELVRLWGPLRFLFVIRKEAARRVASLTRRQREIMDRVLNGQLSKNIAHDLGISQRTVENHRAAIMRKIGAASLPELTRLALAATWDGAEDLTARPEMPDRRARAG